jgi:AraC-like DNA-binding protein
VVKFYFNPGHYEFVLLRAERSEGPSMEILKGAAAIIKPGDNFEHWHQITCRNFSQTESNRISDNHFRACVSLREFGPLSFSEIWSSTLADDLIRVTRSSGDIRKDPRDYFMLWLALAGKTVFAQGGREAQIGAGDLMLHDQTQPFTLKFGRECHAVMITVPRALLVSRIPSAAQYTACKVSAGSRFGALAGSVVRQLLRLEDSTDGELIARVGASAMDLVLTAIDSELIGQTGLGPRQDRRLVQVKRYMLANLHDPELDLEKIAQRQNVAARTLNRLFAREGTTPIRWLWQQRLAAAYKALAERRMNRVTDVAFSLGFSDAAHFSRAFKTAFGQRPEAVRGGDTLRS